MITVGIGFGIDYGIYITSRAMEELERGVFFASISLMPALLVILRPTFLFRRIRS